MDPAEVLADAVRRFGVAIAVDARRTRGLLADYGVDPRRAAALVAAVERGVASEAAVPLPGEPPSNRYERLARILLERTATDDELARWAVETWANALAPSASDVGHDDSSPPNAIARPPADQVNVAPWEDAGSAAGPVPPEAATPNLVDPIPTNIDPDAWQEVAAAQTPMAASRTGPVSPGQSSEVESAIPVPEGEDATPRRPRRRDTTGGNLRRPGTLMAAAALTAVVVTAGIVVLVSGHGGSCASNGDLCVIGQRFAFVDGRQIGRDRSLRPGQMVESTGTAPSVRLRGAGADVYLDRAARVEVLQNRNLELHAGRIWVASGSGDGFRVVVDNPEPVPVLVRGTALLRAGSRGLIVVVRSGTATIGTDHVVSALQRADLAGQGDPSLTPFLPNDIPLPDRWLDDLPVTGDPQPNLFAATVTGRWQWDRTVTRSNDPFRRIGTLTTHRQLDLDAACTATGCTLVASADGATGPVSWDGRSYHAVLHPDEYCAGARTGTYTIALDFQPSAVDRERARPAAVGLTGAWTERFTAGGSCVATETAFDVRASPGAVSPSAFPSTEEEIAMTSTGQSWEGCLRVDKPGGASVSVRCESDGDIASVVATIFTTEDAARAAYDARVAASGVVPGSTDSKTGAREGRLPSAPGRYLGTVGTDGRAEILTENSVTKALVDWVGRSGDLGELSKARDAALAPH